MGILDIVDQAQIQINVWDRDKNSKEIEIAKLHYDSNSDFFEAYLLIFQIGEGNFYSTQDALNKAKTSLDLINQATTKISKIERDYSKTEYYERYFSGKEVEIQEGKKQMDSLKSQIEEILNYYESLGCPEGYVLNDNYECVKSQ